jgi:hypothetical protein
MAWLVDTTGNGARAEHQPEERRTSPRKKAKLEATELMSKHLAPKSKAYKGERKHVRIYLDQTRSGAIKWLSRKCKGSFPKIDHEFVRNLACWFLDNYRKGTLELTQASMNFYYTRAGLPPQWMGIAINRVMRAYKAARAEVAMEAGQVSAAGNRTAVPEHAIEWLLEMAEREIIAFEVLPSRKEATLVEWAVLMLVGWLFNLRASSMSVQKGDIYFSPRGFLVINSDLVKMKDRGVKHQKQCPPPEKNKGPKHPRARLFAVVRKMLSVVENAGVEENIFPALCSDPLEAAKDITEKMLELIKTDVADLPKGKTISSHSWRKACSSGLFAIGCSYQRAIMVWGQWKSQSSCERYIDKTYAVTKFSVGMFDWLPTSVATEWHAEDQQEDP